MFMYKPYAAAHKSIQKGNVLPRWLMTMNYYLMHESVHAGLSPARVLTDTMRLMLKHPLNPWTHTQWGRSVAASCEMFERVTRRYGKPAFGLGSTVVKGKTVTVTEQIVWRRPFCNLIQFAKPAAAAQPKLLIVAPVSGHYATLLRGTVEALLPENDVYITDWADARMVPQSAGAFDLDDYITYVIEMCRQLGPDTHVLAVCQPSVPVIAAVALMEASQDKAAPRSMILMGGPIDTRKSPTAVNTLAQERGMAWFEKNCIYTVPQTYPGAMRKVYPGFLQLSGFMAMNFDKHLTAHWEMFSHLVQGDGDSAEKHREFYDEYLAVMDLTAEFYLQTVDRVFVRRDLPNGTFRHRGARVDLGAIRNTALMTVEGERDDISGVGQTKAAHDLCKNLPAHKQLYHLQKGVGHYGVFNGSRFRGEIVPRINDFIEAHGRKQPQQAARPRALAPAALKKKRA